MIEHHNAGVRKFDRLIGSMGREQYPKITRDSGRWRRTWWRGLDHGARQVEIIEDPGDGLAIRDRLYLFQR